MNVRISPSKANGEIFAPPSKSMAHRVLICAGLAEGTSIVENIDLSEDVKATLGILKSLGCEIIVENCTVTIKGIGGRNLETIQELDCKESGSTLRFFIPLLLTGGKPVRFIGAKRLFERPLEIYENICREQKIFYKRSEGILELSGELRPAHYKIPGNISSQFITGLLFALPLLKDNSIIEALPPVESGAYIEMTIEALTHCGIKVEREGNRFLIPGNQRYMAKDCVVEGDYSNAAFLDAFNLIEGNVRVKGLRDGSLQGDQVYKQYFARLQEQQPEMDISECPDLGPILIGMAAALHGARFTGTKRLKIKESDRGAVMAEELAKFGIRVDVNENDIVVHDGTLMRPEKTLDSHNDHRIAMTLATLCSITGGEIAGAEAVRKSFPNYYAVIKELGIQLEEKGYEL